MATALDRPAYDQTPQPVQGMDMAKIFGMLLQGQQAQQAGALAQQQNYFANTDPLGAVARGNSRPQGLTPGSQWSSMFGDNAASAMTPEARMASQGRSAANQWAQLGGNQNVAPTQLQDLMGQMTPTPGVAGIDSVDQYSDQKFLPRINQQFGFTPRMDLPMDLQGQYQGPMAQMPKDVVAGDGTTNYTRSKPKRKGSSFGMQATGSPRSGFGF